MLKLFPVSHKVPLRISIFVLKKEGKVLHFKIILDIFNLYLNKKKIKLTKPSIFYVFFQDVIHIVDAFFVTVDHFVCFCT